MDEGGPQQCTDVSWRASVAVVGAVGQVVVRALISTMRNKGIPSPVRYKPWWCKARNALECSPASRSAGVGGTDRSPNYSRLFHYPASEPSVCQRSTSADPGLLVSNQAKIRRQRMIARPPFILARTPLGKAFTKAQRLTVALYSLPPGFHSGRLEES
ncbi:hypothetical protein V2G26_013610 [Clonostachys chloroleuca]